MAVKLTKEYLTREIFSNSLEALLESKELDEISVTEIVEHSGLSRSTFYRCFKDKFELASWKFSVMLSDFMVDGEQNNDAIITIRAILDIIDSKRDFFRKLFGYGGQNSFYDYCMNQAVHIASKTNRFYGKELEQREYYITRYHAAGVLYLVNDWLHADEPVSAEEIFAIINENLVEVRKNKIESFKK